MRKVKIGIGITSNTLTWHNGFLYFGQGVIGSRRSLLIKLDPKEKSAEPVLELGRVWMENGSFAFYGDYFYCLQSVKIKRVAESYVYGILSFNLLTGEQTFVLPEELNIQDISEFFLTFNGMRPCGEYLVITCNKTFYTRLVNRRMYAAPMGGPITDTTEWKEIRFPDMKEGTCDPPKDWSAHEYNPYKYFFHDGYAYYLNEDSVVCSRPLFGDDSQVTVYEEAKSVKPYLAQSNFVCFYFGRKKFYYQYEIWNMVNTYQVIEYLGDLPELQKKGVGQP